MGLESESNARDSVTIPFGEICSCVEFFPSLGLLCIAGGSLVSIKHCVRSENSPNQFVLLKDSLTINDITNVDIGSKIRTVTWSPDTQLNGGKTVLRLCAATTHHKIILFTSDHTNTSSVTFEGHKSFINSIAYQSSDSTQFASVSDDLTCKIWDVEKGKVKTNLRLSSFGVSATWNPNNPMQLMVTEKGGIIRHYDMVSGQPIFSLDCHSTPITSADWSHCDSTLVGAVAGNSWYLWDVSQSSQPILSRPAHVNGSSCLRWSRTKQGVFATLGFGCDLKIHHISHTMAPYSCSLPVTHGLSWYDDIVATGMDYKALLLSVKIQ